MIIATSIAYGIRVFPAFIMILLPSSFMYPIIWVSYGFQRCTYQTRYTDETPVFEKGAE